MSSSTVKSDIFISVVSPLQNAQLWIDCYINEVSQLLSQEFQDYEIVLIDNASTDQTAQIVENLQDKVRNLQLYCLARPIPHESAFVVGLEQAIGDVVITVDPAYDPVDPIIEMVRLCESGIDIIYGLRRDRLQGKFDLYNWLSKLFFKLFRYLTKENLPIAASTLRLYTRQALNSFLDNSDRYNLFPVIAAFSGLKYRALNYRRINRTGAAIKRSYIQGVSRAFNLIFLSSSYPLRILSFIALMGAFLNLVYSIYVLFVNVFKSQVAEGWTTLSLQNSVMFFILFAILAVLSEYISRLFISNQERPFYLITKERRSLVLLRKQEINVVRNNGEYIKNNNAISTDK